MESFKNFKAQKVNISRNDYGSKVSHSTIKTLSTS